MSIEKIIASLPEKSADQRKVMRKNAQRAAAQGDGIKAEQAQELLDALDAIDGSLSEQPLTARIVQAFRTTPPTADDEQAIRALLDNPGASPAQLSGLIGRHGITWIAEFGDMCRKRQSLLGAPSKTTGGDEPDFTGLLADHEGVNGPIMMKPEATQAFAELGIMAS